MQHHNNGSHKEHHTPVNKLSLLASPKKESNGPKSNRKGRKFSSAGTKSKKSFDRPLPFRIPRTSFSCRGRAPGYYADMEADCQVELSVEIVYRNICIHFDLLLLLLDLLVLLFFKGLSNVHR